MTAAKTGGGAGWWEDMSQPEYPDEDFSPRERKELRRMLDGQKKTEWLWNTLRVWAIWIAAIIGGATLLLQALRDGLRAIVGGNGQ